MENYNSNFTPFLLLLFFFLFIFQTSIQQGTDVCKNVDCGIGLCIASNNSITGYECICSPDWNRIFPVPFSPCAFPNCALNFQCGNGAPPPPTPPLLPLPPINFTDPCNLVWCGDGTCIANGTSHYCQCFDGFTNLLNLTGMLDCCKLRRDPNQPPPPPPLSNGMLAPPPRNESAMGSKVELSQFDGKED
ncbi:uncharacterized protein LOC111400399 [Olea europaea var. sylvestris]|uniref:uncharacterized protein LOC111400399 n=1 Tax=Olea europaea var. sylvestris TaxID=158386 RepID=UPI000C1D3864|nr:uncharacterized protein LOC111400399 [Olea europaea var. sylvestris]